MKRTLEIAVMSDNKFLFAALTACLTLGACKSGDNRTAQQVLLDDSGPDGIAVPGMLNDDIAPGELSFTIKEDTTLDGLFASSVTELISDYTIISLPRHGQLTLRSEGTVFRYAPEPDFWGDDEFIYSTSDGTKITATIDVTPVPDAPELDKDFKRTANQGKSYSIILEAIDGDDDELVYRAENLPEWLQLDSRTGLLSGVPRQSDIGMTDVITITVSDGTGLSDILDDLQLDVVDINDPPSLNTTQVPRKLYGGEQVAFSVFPDDQDNDGVIVGVEDHPAFESSVEGGRITLTMRDFNMAGPSEITVFGRDDRGAVNREAVPVFLYPRTVSGKGTTVSGFKDGRGLNIIILGDGYAADQQQAFERHVEGVLDYIGADEGIASHLGAFNIHMISTVSRQSGSDDSDLNDTVDTAFDSAYNCRSIPRLVCADTLKLYTAALAEYTQVDQIILLVNNIAFGGSGSSAGRVAITSAFYPEIALHEMGHSLADLADEYVDSGIVDSSGGLPFTEGAFENVSLLQDPAFVPWAHWFDASSSAAKAAGADEIGIFEGGYYRSTGVFRPTVNSRMRDFDEPFGPVNTEQWILRLYTATDGYRFLAPNAEILSADAGQPIEFRVEPIFGADVQQIAWQLNGETLTTTAGEVPARDADIRSMPGANINELLTKTVELQGGGAVEASTNINLSALALTLPLGTHELSLTLSDSSGRIQLSPPHKGIFTKTWEITVR